MTNRRAIKAGKHQRIRKLLRNMRVTRSEPVVKDQQWLASMGDAIDYSALRSSQEGPGIATAGHPEAVLDHRQQN